MKRFQLRGTTLWIAAVLLGGTFCAAWGAKMPKLQIDPSPVPPEMNLKASFASAIQKASPSVVYVYTTKKITGQPMMPFFEDPFFRRFFGIPEGNLRSIPREEHGLGSGVIISENGYILTNNHVVENADEVEVRYNEETYEAKVVGTDPPTDVALLKIDAEGLPAITLTDSDNLKVGDVVLAIGNPFGVGKTVTMGIVSATGRSSLHITDYENFIQTDAAINPGNSGGALIDAKGRLVGINTAIASNTGGYQGIGFAIPINLARNVMKSLLEHGKVVRGYLGVLIQPLNRDLAEMFGLKESEGAVISEVMPGTPAEKAGLKAGDVIVGLNGKKVKDAASLRLKIAQSAPGTTVTLRVIRDGKPREVKVKLGELKEGGLVSAYSGGGQSASDLLDGVTVDDLTSRARRQYGIPERVEGALVVEVSPDSLAYKAGLRPGDVIMSINREPVRNADEAVRVANKIKGNRVLLRVWSHGGSHYLVIRGPEKR